MNSFRLLTQKPLLILGSQKLNRNLQADGYDILSIVTLVSLFKIAIKRPHLIIIGKIHNPIYLRFIIFLCTTVSYFESTECSQIEPRLLDLAEQDLQQGTTPYDTTTDQPRTNQQTHSEFDQLLKTSSR